MKRASPLLFVFALAIIVGLFFWQKKSNEPAPSESSETNEQEILQMPKETPEQAPETSANLEKESKKASGQTKEKLVQSPLAEPIKRITKKPFGIFIDPKTSPVQPEKFRGWHTGTDFEIFEGELGKDVVVKAICSGKILQKKYVGGYGGVIIQNCEFEKKPVTVLYGHLDLETSESQVGKNYKKDQPIATLAKHQSHFSDGERKHLHLGIIKGTDIDLRGYVQTKNQLTGWFDYQKITDLLF